MRKAFKNFVESFKKDEKGITLVELLAVIVILAIVGAIAFVAIGNVIENSRFDAHIANAQQSISAAELAIASGEEVATGVEATSLSTLADTLVDPWGKISDYDFTLSIDADGNVTVSTVTGTECDFTDKTKTQLASYGKCEDIEQR